ncbi:hypothetical protein FQA39_LY11109 [Lamprigera yunnana]|nr:hypothetical protein FQA39_LY11109 [Lamprigera yunnana]
MLNLELIRKAFVVMMFYRYFLKFVDKTLQYWQNRNVKCEEPWPFLGNMAALVFKRTSFWNRIKKWYNDFPKEKYIGIYVFLKPQLVVRDLEVIKRIAIKDFDEFMNATSVGKGKQEPIFTKNLAVLQDENWKNMRAAFTSSKIKYMFPLVAQCAEQATKYFLDDEIRRSSVDILDLARRFASDSICTVAFGYKMNSFVERDNKLFVMGRDISDSGGVQAQRYSMLNLAPVLLKYQKVSKYMQKFTQYLTALCKENLESRTMNGVLRPHLTHLLLEGSRGKLKNKTLNLVETNFSAVQESTETIKNGKKTKLSDEVIVAQTMLFFFGGFETTSFLICGMSYELAINVDVQTKLQEEIDHCLNQNKGEIKYENVLKLKYLDMVVSESLRKWPPHPIIDRICVKDYELEPETAERDAIVIEKNTTVLIPVLGIHYDPKYFSNPDKFDPERFSNINKSKIVPFSFLPFGIGSRNCIASRLALMQVKLFFVNLLSKFILEPTHNTQIPLTMTAKKFTLLPENGFWLGLRKR